VVLYEHPVDNNKRNKSSPKIVALAARFTTSADLGGGIRECGSDQKECDPETIGYRHNECVLKEWLLNNERERREDEAENKLTNFIRSCPFVFI
jgi:hypothetical protein